MSAPELPPSSIAALNPKELEVLRLLAAGHTVKSIAARLGRSESSINERLRDARRKTGIGSSRELARLLDAQKIWDENIDLSTLGFSTDAVAQPRTAGRSSSKGTTIMVFAMPIAALALIVTAASSTHQVARPVGNQVAVAKQLPLVGKWSLDVTRIPVEERPRSVTMEFRISTDRKWTTVVDIVGPDGSSQHAESTAAADGNPVPIKGNLQSADTGSLRQPAPNTLVMTLGKNGIPVSTRVYTVSRDQKSMTETIIWASGSIPKLETTYFTRIR